MLPLSDICGLKLFVLVWVPGQLKRCSARLAKNGENFALMMTFDLENIDPKSLNLHQKEFLCKPTPPSLVFLASLGAEIADGHIMPPPSRARNYQTLASARFKIPS